MLWVALTWFIAICASHIGSTAAGPCPVVPSPSVFHAMQHVQCENKNEKRTNAKTVSRNLCNHIRFLEASVRRTRRRTWSPPACSTSSYTPVCLWTWRASAPMSPLPTDFLLTNTGTVYQCVRISIENEMNATVPAPWRSMPFGILVGAPAERRLGRAQCEKPPTSGRHIPIRFN